MDHDPSSKRDQTSATTRRALLAHAGAAGLAVSLPSLGRAILKDDAPDPNAAPAPPAGMVPIALKVNGETHRAHIDPRASLLDTLRETLRLHGTKKGCDHGQCGACTVHQDGRRVLSCLTLALSAQSHEITTIEGLGTPERMHPMQAAFVEHDGFQCGYCTSGQIMSAVALMNEPVGEGEADVKEAMSGNLCRCGAYANIVDAIQGVRKA